jgi:hypothetical protein
MKWRHLVWILLVLAYSGLPGYASGIRDRQPARDVRRDLELAAGGTLSANELSIAEFTIIFYYLKYSQPLNDESLDAAVKSLTDEQYQHAIHQAAKVAKHPLAQGVLKTGKLGEKLLKALIISIEEGVQATREWLDSQAQKYDDKKQSDP